MEPKNNFEDCYFWVLDVKGFNCNETCRYPDLQSTKCPFLHNEALMLPNSQKSVQSTSRSEWEMETSTPKWFYQNGLSVCDERHQNG